MKVVSDGSGKIVTVYAEDIDIFVDILEVVTDIQLEYAGYESKRQRQKQLMDDMEQQIADLTSIPDME